MNINGVTRAIVPPLARETVSPPFRVFWTHLFFWEKPCYVIKQKQNVTVQMVMKVSCRAEW